MTRRARVDAELVRRGLARSRQQAAELIGAGRVSIDGMPAAKPATAIALSATLTVEGADERSWVSRGAHKLIGALDTFRLGVEDRRCLDAGASTGGFTEVLLDRGAREVVAADVGYGQLAWPLRSDPRVMVLERTNVRPLTADAIGGPVDLVVADLSFISLATVLPALTACSSADADIVPMVKPQFEVGKDRVGPAGSSQTRSCVPTPCCRGRPPGRRAAVVSRRCDRQPTPRAVGECRILPAPACRRR